MALVLCTGVHTALVHTRKLALQTADLDVITALDHSSLLTACRQHEFDIAVICQSCSPELKREWLAIIRKHRPTVRVLEVYTEDVGAALRDVDGWLQAPITPEVLIHRLAAMLNGHKDAHDSQAVRLEDVRKICAQAITAQGVEFDAIVERLSDALTKLR